MWIRIRLDGCFGFPLKSILYYELLTLVALPFERNFCNARHACVVSFSKVSCLLWKQRSGQRFALNLGCELFLSRKLWFLTRCVLVAQLYGLPFKVGNEASRVFEEEGSTHTLWLDWHKKFEMKDKSLTHLRISGLWITSGQLLESARSRGIRGDEV